MKSRTLALATPASLLLSPALLVFAAGLAVVIAGCASNNGLGSTGADGGGSMPEGGLGPWSSTADYPLAANDCAGAAPDVYCEQQTCVPSAGYVYCVGGESASTYYSQLSPTGLGAWMPGADYPEPIAGATCVVSAGYIYCVGGSTGGGDGGVRSPVADAYYAPLLSPGIGAWSPSTPFPQVGNAPLCFADSGYIYCVSTTVDGTYTPDAYYAPLSSSGIGAWTSTAGPPTNTDGCTSIDGYAYCFGGGGCSPAGPAHDCYSPSYFAPLSTTGIGPWQATTELPTAGSAVSASAGSFIYYFSEPVFVANVSANGIGPWQSTTNYPDSSYPANCFSNEGYLYCASGVAGQSYVAQIGVANPQALHLQNPPPYPRSDYLIPAWSNGGGSSVTVNGVSAGAPVFGDDIDAAVVFDCASQASTPAGCATTVTSSDAAYDYDMTIWYPCQSATPSGTNCCFLPALGYTDPFNGWCISIGSNSFIIANEIQLQEAQ